MLIVNEKVEYTEEDGKLCYECQYNSGQGEVTIVKGKVPAEIIKKGKKAIREYVEKKISKSKATDKRFEEFGKNPNVSVSVRYRGVLLRGKVVSASNRYIRVRLEEPKKYFGESGMNFGMASAMAGYYVFQSGDEPKLSRAAIEGAQRVLTWIYDEKKNREDNKDVIDLAEKLNKKK